MHRPPLTVSHAPELILAAAAVAWLVLAFAVRWFAAGSVVFSAVWVASSLLLPVATAAPEPGEDA